ncbi:hypothetical protein BJ166DRAFT_97614 [Pestalotiopsis sp. NC0098]|nr:hypothetical protein BJ166DRAFT_97614 [Pestalotiopsis sp. NC0098]
MVATKCPLDKKDSTLMIAFKIYKIVATCACLDWLLIFRNEIARVLLALWLLSSIVLLAM